MPSVIVKGVRGRVKQEMDRGRKLNEKTVYEMSLYCGYSHTED